MTRTTGWSGSQCAARILLLLFAVMRVATPSSPAQQYAGAGCVATLENRSVPVDADGTYALPNIPVNPGKYRVRVLCPQADGTTLGATSPFLDLVPLGVNQLDLMELGPLLPQPNSLNLQVYTGALTSVGATAQLETQVILPDGSAYDGTPASEGTTYMSSNTAVATVSADGVVTATGPGNVVITARNDGLVTTLMLSSFGLLDSDGDGMPDAYEIANGLDPYNAADANLDPDNDGLTNLQEFLLGTNPHVADTDGDGLNDGDEVKLGTNPLVADTDGDGLLDGEEVRLGTNPLNPDTDGDGIPDGVEVKLGLNPLVPDVTTTVIGHVTNANGSPNAGAAVSLLTYFTATTDTTGAFTLLHVPTTLGNLVVSARIVQGATVLGGSSAATVPVGNGVTDVGTIQIGQTPGQVSGIVTGPDNQPIVRAAVTVMGGSDTRTAVTDSSGLYLVSGLQAGGVSVSVFDPATSLRGYGAGTLTGSSTLTLNVKVAAFGTVSGTVRTATGTVAGSGVNVTISGALNASTTTDALGHYTFSFVPLGTVTIDATDATGNHGRSTGTVTATSQTISADVQYLGRGTVTGTVSDGTGAAVAGASVSLANSGTFSQSMTTTTNSLGQYTFSKVFIGTVYVSAASPTTSAAGNATAILQSEAQSVTANITLQGSGTITGTVYRSNGTTTVANATVTVPYTALTTTADASGKYTFANVPLGNYAPAATDAATGDRGQATANLATAGQTITSNITLRGLGTVNVTVLDGAGATVAGALVTVQSDSPFNQSQSGVTAKDGTLSFTQQLAGVQTVNASNPTTGLAGRATVTLAANGTAAVTVNLQAAGSIQGTVYKIDGTTPVAGINVQLDTTSSTLSGIDGKFSFSSVPTGQHAVYVTDAVGNILSKNTNINVTSQGQVVTANFVIVGRGTVTGQVTNPDGSGAAGVPVSILSTNPDDQHSLGTQTDPNGYYTILLVPVGGYNAVAQQHTSTANAYGTATGTMTAEGATVTTNIQLSSTLVPAAQTFYDANGAYYTVRETGALCDGAFGVFQGDQTAAHECGALLSLVKSGTETAFVGSSFAPTDLGARQVSITQNGLDGLNVTRRVYVPLDGYFARYVEILSNPGTQSVTVDLKLTSYFRSVSKILTLSGVQYNTINLPHILQTSSGDNIFNILDPTTPDHWVTIAGPTDQDPFINNGFTDTPSPPIADVFDGPGGSLTPTAASYSTDPQGTFSTLSETFGGVTVPAGQTVAILHMVSQENSYAGANASAARLVQLPPEALYGLSAADLGAIANFAIPAKGVSALPALPGITSQVSGFVYASDGTTKIPGAGITLQSTDPIFGRLYVGGSDSSGAYTFQGSLGGLAITPENFVVSATHPVTQVVSPNFTGSFASGSTAATEDIVFNNTGILMGTVSRGPTVLNVSGTITLIGSSLQQPIVVPIAVDGTYKITGLPPGTYSVTAAVTNTLLTGLTTAVITAPNTTTANITIGVSGNIAGTVTRANGSLAIGDTVNLRANNLNPLTTIVDTSGHYMFTDVPTGTFTVDCYDPQTNAAATAPVNVTANTTTTQDLSLQSAGKVTGTVSVNDGSSVANLTITLTSTTSSGTQTLSVITDANGNFTFSGVNPGTLVLRTTSPAGLQGTGTGSLPLAGQTVIINIALTAAGSLTGTVFQGDGVTPAPGIQVTLSPAPLSGGSATVTTDANGQYSYSLVSIGGFTVYASNTANGDAGQASGQIQTNGQIRTINITLNGFGNITVKVTDQNSNIIANAAVTFRNNSIGKTYTATADSTGTAVFTNVFAGSYTITARDPVTGLNNTLYGSLPASTSPTVTVKLQAVGTVKGTVYAADGVTPVANAAVVFQYFGNTTTAADGTYTFANVPISNYNTVYVTDAAGVVRAKNTQVGVQHNGDVVVVNFTYAGVGSVSGKVTNIDGTPVENTQLLVNSQNATLGGNQYVTTGGDGTYVVPELAVGKFTITVQNLPSGLTGYASGTIATDGSSQVLNIQLQSSTVSLPITLTDADGYPYSISANGGISNANSYAGAAALNGTNQLSFNSGSEYASFASGGAPTTALQSLAGQQVEITQSALAGNVLAGLSVTRKIYVPTTGYFVRHFETLKNTTNAPITVIVNETGTQRVTLNVSPVLTATSSVNNAVDATTLWLVDNDDNGSLPVPRSQPAVANVFAGTGAGTGVGTVTHTATGQFYGQNKYYYFETLGVTYKPVTVPANGSVGFLFFTAQEAGSSTAITAAQRLVQLPAEALSGLSTAELASVVNFVVPATPLAAVLPPAQMVTLSGNVYAGDGTTVVPSATVYAQSTNLYFGTAVQGAGDARGAYTLPALQADTYAVEAVDPGTSVTSAAATGTSPASSGAQTQNVPFTGTGIVQGLVKGTGTTTFSGGSVYITWNCNNQYCGSANANYDSSGAFGWLTIPAGNDSISTNVTLPQNGSIYLGNYGIGVTAGQTTQFTFTLPGTGSIVGAVKNANGTPASGVTVYISGATTYFSETVITDSTGGFAFMSIPLDTYQVVARDPVTNGTVSKSSTVAKDVTNTVALTFIGKGTVVATVHYANGNVAQGVQLTIATSTNSTFTYAANTTDANGQYSFANVPTGAYTVRAYYPGQNFYSTTTSSLTSDGQTQQLAVTLTPVGTISGKLTNADGSVVANNYVSIGDTQNGFSSYAITDSAGNFGFFPVPADRVVNLTSSLPNNTTGRTITAKALNQQVPGDNQTLTVNLRFPGLATVHVTALKADNTPYTSGQIGIQSTDGSQNYTANTGTDGTATFTSVVEADFVARAYVCCGSFNAGSTSFTVKPSDDNHTVEVVIHTSPTGTVKGQVFASDGTTVIRDGYSIVLTDVTTGATASDNPQNGAGFNFTGVQVGAGGYSLAATLNNYPGTQTLTGTITTEGQVDTRNITLPVSSISGTVYLNDGVTPVPNANISFSSQVNGQNKGGGTTADANGTFQFSGPVTGDVTITASDDNGVNATTTVTLATDTSIVTGTRINLAATGYVVGMVYDNSGTVQPNTQVTIHSDGDGGGFYQTVFTDGSGYYTAGDVPTGNITVSADIGTAPTETNSGILMNNGDSITLNLGQVPGVSGGVFGTVYDGNQNPAEGATVTVTSASGTVVTGTTDSNGLYSVTGLPAGDLTVSAKLSDGTDAGSTLATIADIQVPIEVEVGLQTTGQVSGFVYDANGNALANYDVHLSTTGDPNTGYSESSGADGSYVFGGIAPGVVTVTVTAPNQTDVLGTATVHLPFGGNAIVDVNTTVNHNVNGGKRLQGMRQSPPMPMFDRVMHFAGDATAVHGAAQ